MRKILLFLSLFSTAAFAGGNYIRVNAPGSGGGGGSLTPGTTPVVGGTNYANLSEDGTGKLAATFVQKDHSGVSAVDFDNRILKDVVGTTTIIDWTGNQNVNAFLSFDIFSAGTSFGNDANFNEFGINSLGHLNMSGTIDMHSNSIVNAEITADNVTAAHFFGDGSSITDLSAAAVSGLATVATTGNYADLSNVPITASGIQNITLNSNGLGFSDGFTGSGVFTTFTIVGGIITNAF